MDPFNILEASAPRRIPAWFPFIGGVLVASAVAAFAGDLPRVHSLSWGGLLGSAIERELGVVLAGAITAWALCAMWHGTEGRRIELVLQTCFHAFWLPPLALFIRENSLWAPVIGALLVASITKSLRLMFSESPADESDDLPMFSLQHDAFMVATPTPWIWRQVCATAVVLCAQAGLLAGLAGFSFLSASLVAISAAVWTRSLMNRGGLQTYQSSYGRKSTTRRFALMALGILFTAAALYPYLRTTYRIRGFGSRPGHHSSRRLAKLDQRGKPIDEKTSELGEHHGLRDEKKASDRGDQGPQNQGPQNKDQLVGTSFATFPNSNTGVILWAKEQKITNLIAPAPIFGNSPFPSLASSKPLVIPFSGVYWFFKAPDLRPPESSRQAHGSPEVLDIHSTDRRPLSMEAHEHLGSMINLDCCSRIQVSIRNADLYPETVSLELVLIDSGSPGKPSQSLGTIVVKSTPSWQLYREHVTASETLNFRIPPDHSLRRFDEIMIVYRLDAFRADDGAKVAIDHFVLVPRGL